MPANPPAFPRTGEGVGNPHYDVPGMDLRDWFAGQFLAGVGSCIDKPGNVRYGVIAMDAYAAADAMLAERERASV